MVPNKAFKDHEVNFTIKQLEQREAPKNVLLCTPFFYSISRITNANMQKGTSVDHQKAMAQWFKLKESYFQLKALNAIDNVAVIDGEDGLEDMVFCANQTFPWMDKHGKRKVILSRMRHSSRRDEVSFFGEFFRTQGYQIIELEKGFFEGSGDIIPHPGKNLIYGGFGQRSSEKVYDIIAQELQVPIVKLELKNPYFYHLDTCFLPISSERAMLCPEAFNSESLDVIGRLFKEVINVQLEEALRNFALNAHCINTGNESKHVIIQEGSNNSNEILSEAGYNIIEADTSEYIKSGGSVFCMKQTFY